MNPLLLTALLGCWKPYADLPALDFDEVPYTNPYLNADDAVISAFDTSLECPDGSAARFFAVYRQGMQGNAPVAIVLHSGAFDYVVEPDATGDLYGRHYQAESRLDRSWSIGKVWETLGINPNIIDSSEDNQGTLPAALTDAGIVQLYPGNCWGDLWHDWKGNQDNQYEVEGFSRNGGNFAYWMIRMIVEQEFAGGQGFQIPVGLDSSQVYLIGLGEGGRGVLEILGNDNLPPIGGALIDSSPDDLRPYLDDPQTYEDEIVGLERIFRPENLDAIETWSLPSLAEDGLIPDRTGFIWSSGDTHQPNTTMSGAAAVVEGLPQGWSYNTEQPGHVFLNGDPELAQAAVGYLTSGVAPQ